MDSRNLGSGIGFPVEGFILCGGASSRFGSDKALARWKGRPLLVHAVDALRELGLTPRLVTHDPVPYLGWARAFVTRERPGLGPLEGVRAALRSAATPWALVLSVDMPRVESRHLRLLGRYADPNELSPAPAVIFGIDDRRHPFPGLYHRTHLAAGDSLPDDASLGALLDHLPVHVLGIREAGEDLPIALTNVNRPEDLKTLAGTRESI